MELTSTGSGRIEKKIYCHHKILNAYYSQFLHKCFYSAKRKIHINYQNVESITQHTNIIPSPAILA